MPVVCFFASLYGICNPLKAKGSLGFRIKYFFKTEESTIFVRRTYAIIWFILNLFYCVYCALVILLKIDFSSWYTIMVLIISVIVPAIITIIAYFILFDKEGHRK